MLMGRHDARIRISPVMAPRQVLARDRSALGKRNEGKRNERKRNERSRKSIGLLVSDVG